MILVTGPTGSGKSTTLYATLNQINRPEVNIITVEDPVEYRLPGINQVQTNAKAGLTFAAALRSILRADPDIVLIGEIRDHETAQIAIEAALTGHLVLSTLHTNDAPSAVTRLTEMGIEPFLVGSALDCVLAQRLARRLCSKCKEPYTPTPETLVAARYPWKPDEPVPTLHRAVGCAKCAKTGYKGRVALHEVMSVSEEIERLTVERAPRRRIETVAHSEGMVTLRQDGMHKVARGSRPSTRSCASWCDSPLPGSSHPVPRLRWSTQRAYALTASTRGGIMDELIPGVAPQASGPQSGPLAGDLRVDGGPGSCQTLSADRCARRGRRAAPRSLARPTGLARSGPGGAGVERDPRPGAPTSHRPCRPPPSAYGPPPTQPPTAPTAPTAYGAPAGTMAPPMPAAPTHQPVPGLAPDLRGADAGWPRRPRAPCRSRRCGSPSRVGGLRAHHDRGRDPP